MSGCWLGRAYPATRRTGFKDRPALRKDAHNRFCVDAESLMNVKIFVEVLQLRQGSLNDLPVPAFAV